MILGDDTVCRMGSVSAWVVMGRFYRKDGIGSSSLDGEVSGGL